jgi:hypothetical protein
MSAPFGGPATTSTAVVAVARVATRSVASALSSEIGFIAREVVKRKKEKLPLLVPNTNASTGSRFEKTANPFLFLPSRPLYDCSL